MKRSYMLLLLVASTVITGCVPFWVYDYYSPSAKGGSLKKSNCHELSGPPGTIEFKRNDVIIKIRAEEVQNGYYVRVELRIPKGRVVRLDNLAIKIYSSSNSIIAEGLLSPHVYEGETPWKIEEPMIGGTIELNVGPFSQGGLFGPRTYEYSYYEMESTVTMIKSDVIIVYMPDLYIDDIKVQLPEIQFKKDKFLEFFTPINC